jgi:DNA-directed RNA polymerase specialized sigma24 family protein
LQMDEPPSVAAEGRAFRQPHEISEALRSLDAFGWARLRKIAAVLAAGGRGQEDELLQETMLRVLDGGRLWPQGLPLMSFLAGVMKSVAHGERAKVKRSPVRRAASLYDGSGALVIDMADAGPTPEDSLAEEQAAGRIKQRMAAAFEGDFDAQMLLEGMLDGMEGEPLRGLTELDPTAYASKRRLIRRRLSKLQAEGGQP